MAGLLDFLTGGGQGGSGLLGYTNPLMDSFGGNQGMILAGLGLASGATPGEGFKNMLPALQQAYEQQNAQKAGMALLNTLPGGNQPQQQPSSMPPSPASRFMAPPTIGAGIPASNAIASIESGGNYGAVGPVIDRGSMAGDRAYGKYQVMGANVGPWTKAHYGQELTPEQFLQNPEAQDAVFKGQFGQYVNKYGPNGAARAWFAGPGGMNNMNATDQLGTSVADYGNRFSAANGTAAPAMAPPAGSPMLQQPGSGLTLVDSPALQGMPDSVRKAIPLMLQSRTMAPQAMALIQKYINPDQWQMWRDSMGNVFTRNSATGESKPLLTPTPQMMNANASGLPSPLAYETATAFGQSAAKNTELTGTQKEAAASGPGMTPSQYETEKIQSGELAKNWVKKYETSVDAGASAQQALPQLNAVKNIVQNDPNFYSGIGENYNLALKKIWVAAGGDPNTAASQELVGKVLSGQIVAGLRTSFGGLGQVRVAELNALQNSLASKGNTPAALAALVTMAQRTQQRAADIADIAMNYNNGTGKLDAGFDRAVADYDRAHPMFSPEEIANYKKIAGGQTAPATPTTNNPYEAEMRRRGLLK